MANPKIQGFIRRVLAVSWASQSSLFVFFPSVGLALLTRRVGPYSQTESALGRLFGVVAAAEVLHSLRYDFYWPSSLLIGATQIFYALGLVAVDQYESTFDPSVMHTVAFAHGGLGAALVFLSLASPRFYDPKADEDEEF